MNFDKYNAAPYKIFIYEPLAQCAVSLRFDLNERLWVVAYESLKTKEKSSLVIPKLATVVYGSGRLLVRAFRYKVYATVQAGFHKGGLN